VHSGLAIGAGDPIFRNHWVHTEGDIKV
jgi:hypothetical protein